MRGGDGGLVHDDGDLREPPDGAEDGRLQGRGELQGDAVGSDPLEGLPDEGGELHPVVEDREGVDRAEGFEVEAVGHGLHSAFTLLTTDKVPQERHRK